MLLYTARYIAIHGQEETLCARIFKSVQASKKLSVRNFIISSVVAVGRKFATQRFLLLYIVSVSNMCVAAVLLHSVQFKRASSVARKPCMVQIANSYYKIRGAPESMGQRSSALHAERHHNVRVMAAGSDFFLLGQIAYDEHSHDNDDDGDDDEDAFAHIVINIDIRVAHAAIG